MHGRTCILSVVYAPFDWPNMSHSSCNDDVTTFTAVTRVQIPSGTPNLINNLEEQKRFFAGTKRNSRTARSVRPAVPQLHFPRFLDFFVGTKRHRLIPQLWVRRGGREANESLHSALCVFVP